MADFTGAVVLTGSATPGPEGLTQVALDGGGSVMSTDAGAGAVAVSVFPWEIAVRAARPGGAARARRRTGLEAEITSITELGNRVRLGLAAGQPLAAEVTLASTHRLALREGTRVVATWKAAATRLVETC